MCRNSTSHGEGKGGRTGLGCLKEKMHLVSATSLRTSMTPIFMARNHLPRDWWDEGKGWLRWVLSICHPVGYPGVPRGARSWASLPSTSSYRPWEEIGPGSPGPGAQSALGALAHEGQGWQIEGVTHPLQHPQEGRSPTSAWTGLFKLLVSVNKLPLYELKKKKKKKKRR